MLETVGLWAWRRQAAASGDMMLMVRAAESGPKVRALGKSDNGRGQCRPLAAGSSASPPHSAASARASAASEAMLGCPTSAGRKVVGTKADEAAAAEAAEAAEDEAAAATAAADWSSSA